jgi:DNA gyrase inhibitor GyrI
MDQLEVRIVKLEPMRLVSAYGFGREPEVQAWEQLQAWMKRHGLGFAGRRSFGFNNPGPAPGSPNYGYEQWLTVDAEIEPDGGLRLQQFAGGLYAVTLCQGVPNPMLWGQLVQWREASPYRPAYHQWLEELLTPEHIGAWDQAQFDLYLPIAE